MALNKVTRNKKILIDEDKCWKFVGNEVPGGDLGFGVRLCFDIKGEKWHLIPGEESIFDDGSFLL